MRSKTKPGVKLPKVSVVIPAYNEEYFLPLSLSSLKKQDYAGEYEVIVVDNNSTDHTTAVAQQWGVRVMLETKKGPACARQCGVDAAKGDIIAFLDADTIAPKNWLTQIVKHFQNHPRTIVVSGPYSFNDINIVERLASYAFNFVNISLDHLFRKACRKGGALWGCNFAVRRTAIEKVGGFNTGIPFYGEDYELSLRLKEVGRGDLLPFLYVFTSARRVRKLGVVTQYWNWIINYFSVLFYNHPISKKLEDLPSRAWQKLVRNYTLQRMAAIFGFILIFAVIVLFDSILLTGFIRVTIYIIYSMGLVAWLIYNGVNPRSKIFGNLWAHGSREKKVLALTFDDGPQPYYTEKVLEILEEHGIKATFFLIGNQVRKHPEICRRIAAQGHVIGNHSEHHHKWLCLKSSKKIAREVQNTEQAIRAITGESPQLFRPPHGFRSPWLMKTLASKGYQVVTWDNMTNDWEASKPAKEIVNEIVQGASSGGILILHDGRSSREHYDREQMLFALPEIITALKSKGFAFVTVPELIRLADIS